MSNFLLRSLLLAIAAILAGPTPADAEHAFYDEQLYSSEQPAATQYFFHWTTEEWKAFDYEIIAHYRKAIAVARKKGDREVDLQYLADNNRHFRTNLPTYLEERRKQEQQGKEAGEEETAPAAPQPIGMSFDLDTADYLLQRHWDAVWAIITASDLFPFGRGFYIATNPCSSIFYADNRTERKKKDINNLVVFRFKERLGRNPVRYFRAYRNPEKLAALFEHLRRTHRQDLTFEYDARKSEGKDVRYLLPNGPLVEWLLQNVDLAGYYNDGEGTRSFLSNQYINDDYHVVYNPKLIYQAEIHTLWNPSKDPKKETFYNIINEFIRTDKNNPDINAYQDKTNVCHLFLKQHLPLMEDHFEF
ncbi:MAG: hypothetical protein A2284_06660 [Deltaproteobacteria bacterium RIFOXYA12_FULL_61_11]|nr:MAG: hypothetical protein A2284_06660 [Deltaproteobacteria bacterium RIFOXYA12_FULL_61_11]